MTITTLSNDKITMNYLTFSGIFYVATSGMINLKVPTSDMIQANVATYSATYIATFMTIYMSVPH